MIRVLRLKFALGVVVALSMTALAAGPANADPLNAKNASPITLNCGGGDIDAVTNGNGGFTPAHDVDGTGVFVPVLFGPQTGVFTDPEGNEFPFSDDTFVAKGSANPHGRTILDCTFHADLTFPDGATLVVDGEVTGFFSG